MYFLISVLVLLFGLCSRGQSQITTTPSLTSSISQPVSSPCGRQGTFQGADTGEDSPIVLGTSTHFGDSNPSVCARDCKIFAAACVSFAARLAPEGELCTFFSEHVDTVIEAIPDGSNLTTYTFFELSCFASPSSVSSSTTTSSSSPGFSPAIPTGTSSSPSAFPPTRPTTAATPITTATSSPSPTPPEVFCAIPAWIKAFDTTTDDAPHVLGSATDLQGTTLDFCRSLCLQRTPGCVAFAGNKLRDASAVKCYLLDARADQVATTRDATNGDLQYFFDKECDGAYPPWITAASSSVRTGASATVTAAGSVSSGSAAATPSPTVLTGAADALGVGVCAVVIGVLVQLRALV